LKSGLAGLGPVGVEYGGGPFLKDHWEGEAADQSGLGLGLGPSLWLEEERRFNGDGRITGKRGHWCNTMIYRNLGILAEEEGVVQLILLY
jgi:hypothetical protein